MWLWLDLKGSWEYLTTHFYPNFWVSGYELGLEGLLGSMILIERGKNGVFVLNSSPFIGNSKMLNPPQQRSSIKK